ncbi:hypothetical protein TPHA_0D02590 [Tetrapisispora phaffii CBS 4417]|uniref:Extracellular mutant protein 11 C-terminal domain-containing protein n=1 Tax=Tetrapisispora phaffii (strain ATCC 24235 / CBS 4417 / NBRC 1672 / NRRL Y-8282 / UCD 70-5) TaxID=1071381 RepID=G8BSS5_TETPH|nr:hypothetical protein TPHA_0D02590 [Tetrapisispora phaffii CBS 4417]CCE62896.1 hypothetical protein TPHA_0D02590 [Tetrapisispora phaffii CBS 4417]
MALIKRESDTYLNNIVVKQEKSSGNHYNNEEQQKKFDVTSAKESRPALDEVSTNKKSIKARDTNSDQKQKYLNYLLKTDTYTRTPANQKIVSAHPPPSRHQENRSFNEGQNLDTSKEISKNKRCNSMSNDGKTKEDFETISKQRKKNSVNSIKDINDFSSQCLQKEGLYESKNLQDKNDTTQIINKNPKEIKCVSPGPYKPSTSFLYEIANSEQLEYTELKDIFQNINETEDKDYVFDVSNMTLDTWVEEGQKNISEYRELISQLVKKRIEFSIRFQLITDIINQRANALNEKGLLLDDKLKKIKEIGDEILNII